jgi:DNA-binding transcriptional MerR regulator|tara:strand:+ start:472 stop:1410 length:939 start_codon:yes stop_codon:yes gene_type:complete
MRKEKNLTEMEDYLSIGQLARFTGVGIHSLRAWEKRYGAPRSQRLSSGHRRFPKEEVQRLRAVSRALESGYRPGNVATKTLVEIEGLLGAQDPVRLEPKHSHSGSALESREMTLESWMKDIAEYREEVIRHSFHDLWNRVGPLNFLVGYIVPFIEKIGDGWCDGDVTIGQEHFATQLTNNFLSSKWRQLNTQKDGPKVVLATLPEETHSTGLLMCAVVTSLTNFKIVFLGPDTPVKDIVKTTKNCRAQLLCLSVSGCVDSRKAINQLDQIRRGLNEKINIAVGGKGAPDVSSGAACFENLPDYYKWINEMEE